MLAEYKKRDIFFNQGKPFWVNNLMLFRRCVASKKGLNPQLS